MRSVPAAISITHGTECRDVVRNPEAMRLFRIPEGRSEPPGGPEGDAPDCHFRDCRRRPVRSCRNASRSLFAARDGVEVLNAELSLAFPDGTPRHVLGNAVPLRRPDGTVRGAVAAFIDVTESRRAEEALRESEEQFRTLADSIPQLAWMARPGRLHLLVQPPLVRVHGHDAGADGGLGLADGPRPRRTAAGAGASGKAAIASGEPWEDTFPLRRHDGEMRWHLSRALPVRDDDGAHRALVRHQHRHHRADAASWKRPSRRPTAARTSSWRCSPTSCATRSPPIRNAVELLAPARTTPTSTGEWAMEVIEPAGQAPRPADRRPARRLPHHPGQDPAPEGARRRRPGRRAAPSRPSGPLIEERKHELDGLARRRARCGSRPTRPGSSRSLVEPAHQRRQVHRAGGRIRLTAEREGDEVVIRCADNGHRHPARDAARRCSSCSPRGTARSPAPRGAWASA